jgi:thymidylate synthase (FAD)
MVPGTPEQYERQVKRMKVLYGLAYKTYEKALDDGVAKEVAREVLPVAIYSSMYATANLRAWFSFLSLRVHDPDATFVSYPQYEIEQAARMVEDLVAELFPIAYDAFIRNGRVAP